MEAKKPQELINKLPDHERTARTRRAADEAPKVGTPEKRIQVVHKPAAPPTPGPDLA